VRQRQCRKHSISLPYVKYFSVQSVLSGPRPWQSTPPPVSSTFVNASAPNGAITFHTLAPNFSNPKHFRSFTLSTLLC
jgi:hypothetical protein